MLLTHLYYMPTFLTCQVKCIRIMAGLPNITGNIGRDSTISMYATSATNGAFKVKDAGSYKGINGSTNLSNFGVNASFDASRSNPIYGSSVTVTPLSKSTLYILKY